MSISIPAARSLTAPQRRRPVDVVYLLDRSGSMNADGKIQALNTALAESIALLADADSESLTAEYRIRIASFADGAEWSIADATAPAAVRWSPLHAGGLTDLGAALRLVADAFAADRFPDALSPVIVLVSDGAPTDDYRTGLEALDRALEGTVAVRLAIAIGHDADVDVLREFMGHDSTLHLARANHPEAVVEAVTWATSMATRAADGRLRTVVQPDGDIFDLDAWNVPEGDELE